MTWHLKDRELEKKLIAIDPKFVRGLQKAVKYHKDETTVEVGFGGGLGGLSRFTAEFRWDELEEIPEYNPHAWNEYPKVTPPEGVLMRIEFILDGILRRNCSTFEKGAWRITKNGDPSYYITLDDVKRFRPWDED